MSKFLDEWLRKDHQEAGEDFDKGETTDGKDMDDRIGYIHDALKRLEAYFGTDKVEDDKSLQKEAVKDGTKEQEEMKKDDNKDKGDK